MPNRIRRANPRSTHHEHCASSPVLLPRSAGSNPAGVGLEGSDSAGEVVHEFSGRASGTAATPEAAEFEAALKRALTITGVLNVWDDDEGDEDDDLFDDDDDEDDDDVDDDEDFDDLDEDDDEDEDDDVDDDDLFDEEDEDEDEDDELDVDDDEDAIDPEVHALARA